MLKAVVPAFAAMGLLLASCSGSTAGNTAPATSSNTSLPSTSAASSGVPANVPQVPDPIDMTQYKQHPCSVLTETQLQKLSIPTEPNPRPDAPGGPGCEWNAYDETGIVLNGSTLTAGSSLVGSYQKNERGGFENFKPIKVADYPGYLNWDDDASCTANVGVRNDLLYAVVARINEYTPPSRQPCEIAKQAAELATKTMSGGS